MWDRIVRPDHFFMNATSVVYLTLTHDKQSRSEGWVRRPTVRSPISIAGLMGHTGDLRAAALGSVGIALAILEAKAWSVLGWRVALEWPPDGCATRGGMAARRWRHSLTHVGSQRRLWCWGGDLADPGAEGISGSWLRTVGAARVANEEPRLFAAAREPGSTFHSGTTERRPPWPCRTRDSARARPPSSWSTQAATRLDRPGPADAANASATHGRPARAARAYSPPSAETAG